MAEEQPKRALRKDALKRFVKLVNQKNSAGEGVVATEDVAEVKSQLKGVAYGSAAIALTIIPATTFLTYRSFPRLGSGTKLVGGLLAGLILENLTTTLFYGSRIEKAQDVLRKYPEFLK